jgi:hypothetical protein
MEYCITQNKPISIKVLEYAFGYNFRVYLERKDIIPYASPEQAESVRTDLEGLATRIQSFILNIASSENPLIHYHVYFFRAKTMLYIDEDPE